MAREWPVEQIREWIESDLLTHAEVAKRLNCAAQTVGKLCAKHGVQTQRRGPRSGPGHPNWKGGRMLSKDGYILVWTADHPHARRQHRVHGGGYILEHRLVMEEKLGRLLEPGEVVHHLNGEKTDNRPENLELFGSNADHLRHELTGRCPKWTAAGRERTLAGVRRRHAKNRQRKALDAQRSPGSSDHPKG